MGIYNGLLGGIRAFSLNLIKELSLLSLKLQKFFHIGIFTQGLKDIFPFYIYKDIAMGEDLSQVPAHSLFINEVIRPYLYINPNETYLTLVCWHSRMFWVPMCHSQTLAQRLPKDFKIPYR